MGYTALRAAKDLWAIHGLPENYASDFGEELEIEAAVDDVAPAAPGSFSLTEVAEGILLEWIKPSINDNGSTCRDLAWFKVYVREDAEVPEDLSASDRTVLVQAESHRDRQATDAGVTYHYRVTAIDATGNESVPTSDESGSPNAPSAPDPVVPDDASGLIFDDTIGGDGVVSGYGILGIAFQKPPTTVVRIERIRLWYQYSTDASTWRDEDGVADQWTELFPDSFVGYMHKGLDTAGDRAYRYKATFFAEDGTESSTADTAGGASTTADASDNDGLAVYSFFAMNIVCPGEIRAAHIHAGEITANHLSFTAFQVGENTLDDVGDGTNYSRVLTTDIDAGHIKLSETVGDLDDIGDGTTYSRVLTTDISSGHIKLSETVGDLDDIGDGTTYSRVLTTDIDAGHITVVGSTASININNTTFGNEGIQLQYNGGSPQLYVGNGSGAFMQYTTANGVEIAGKITVTGGSLLGQPGGANVLYDGGMEQSSTPYWGSSGAQETSGGSDSNSWWKLTRSGSNVAADSLDHDGSVRYVEVNEGEVWEFGVDIKTDGTCTGRATVYGYDKDKVAVGGNAITSGDHATGTWTTKSNSITIAAGTKFLRFRVLALTADGWAGFDNCFLRRADLDWSYIQNVVVQTADIENLAVTEGKIANLAVTGAKIANATITDAQIGSLSATKITAGTLDCSGITVSNLSASSITTGTLSAGYISGGTLNFGAISRSALAVLNSELAGSITSDKITSLVASKVSAGTFTGCSFQTASGNPRLIMSADAGIGEGLRTIAWYEADGTMKHLLGESYDEFNSGLGSTLAKWGDTVSYLLNDFGVMTATPSNVFSVNQGAGNAIADDWDTYSRSSFKEDIAPAISVLDRLCAVPVMSYRRVPHVSAEELKEAAINEFGRDRWDSVYPEAMDHRGGALLDCPDEEMRAFLDTKASNLRRHRRGQEQWKRRYYGVLADADDVEANAPEILSRDRNGEIQGITLGSYVGMLHAAILELNAKVDALGG